MAGAKLILVLGHKHCGAVKGAIDNVELGNITPMLKNIRPVIEHFTDYEGDKTSENEVFVHMVAEQNVRIVGDLYGMGSGTVTFFEE